MNTLKEKIKTLVEEQKVLKNQRKTVNLVGARTMDPSEAAWKHNVNRDKLRSLYNDFHLLKGKDVKWIRENVDRNCPNMSNFDSYVENLHKLYGTKTVRTS
jgi:hypothetical protein